MEKLTRYFAENRLLVNLIIVLLFFLGIKSMLSSQKEGFPATAQNKVKINTVYPGASSRDVELNVTVPLEDELRDISNVKEILSTSREGISTITVIGDDDLNEKQFAKVYDDIGDALAKVKELPIGLDSPPSYTQLTSEDMPIIEIALQGAEDNLRTFIPFYVNQLKKNAGISKIVEVGFPDEELVIEVNAKKMNKFEVDFKSIVTALRSRNIEGSGGTLESYIGQKKIVAFNKFNSTEEILSTNIRKSADGKGVRIKDVATIKKTPKDLKLQVRNSGDFGVSLIVIKKSNGDLLKTIDKILKLTNTIKKPAGVTINLLNDQSVLTRDRLRLLSGNALLGILLVVITLFFVLGAKTAFWTAASIPLSLVGTFIFLPYLGITINSISLAGFVLVLGMLVDDAIVVAEQVNKEKENGLKGIDSAMVAVKKIWKPILGASITTVLAYYPISQMGGMAGKFVWMIPAVVGIALLISLFDTYFLLPNHLAHGKHIASVKGKTLLKIESIYRKILEFSINYRYLVLVFFLFLLVSAGFVAATKLRKEPFPQDSAEGFTIELTGVPGISMQKAEDNLKVLEKHLSSLPASELAGFSSRIGTQSKLAVTERGTEPHLGIIFVYLKPFSQRSRSAQFILDELKLSMAADFKKLEIRPLFEIIRIGPPVGRPFEIRVSSKDDKLRTLKSLEIKEKLRNLKGVLHVADDQVYGKKELNLILNYDHLASVGLTVDDVLQTIRLAFDGQVVTDYVENNRPIDIRVRLDSAGRGDAEFLKTLNIINRNGKIISLQRVTSFKERLSLSQIKHINGDRTTVIFGQLDKVNQTPASILTFVKKEFPSSEEVQVAFAGEPIENQKIFGSLGMAAVTAIFGVFIVIALTLKSMLKPLIVLSAIPFGVVGIILAVWSHGMPLSMFVIISLIGLSGIIVNDSLVMVFTISNLIESSTFNLKKIIEGAVTRLRPVLLTTITTALGLFPTAYGLGGSDPFISPMCLALMYGLLFGTFITLILIPILYSVGQDFNRWKYKEDQLHGRSKV